MSNFSISCQHSKIENNKSFYGSYCLGTFDPSLSITIANSLRRVLLSEINGLGIVSVQIQGVTHEYSNLEGVHEPILDILLNLKELILKKSSKNFKPQIAYLNVRGPGIVRASNIVLPSCIQCVDPNQYIATLSENGILNMKIYINYGNKWLMSSNKLLKNTESFTNQKDSNDLNYEKRNLIIKKLMQLGLISSNLSKEEIFKQGDFFLQKSKKLEKIRLQKLNKLSGTSFKRLFPYLPREGPSVVSKRYDGKKISISSSNLSVEEREGREEKISDKIILYPNIVLEKRLKMPLKKTLLKFIHSKTVFPSYLPSLSSVSPSKTDEKDNTQGNDDTQEKDNTGRYPMKLIDKQLKSHSNNYFLNPPNSLTIDSIFNPINKVNYAIEINDSKTSLNLLEKASSALEFYNIRKSLNYLKTDLEDDSLEFLFNSIQNKDSNDVKNKKDNLSILFGLKEELNLLKKETIKHNIIIEIWTNGSIHPRDALYQAFKKLIKTYSVLHKVNPFINSSFNLQKLDVNLESNELISTQKYLLKQTKLKNLSSQFDKNLIPLNEKYFIDTYLPPSFKNYYFNSNSLTGLFNKNFILNETILASQLNLDTFSQAEKENKMSGEPSVEDGKKIFPRSSKEISINLSPSVASLRYDGETEKEPNNTNIKLINMPKLNKLYKLDISYLKFSLRTYTVLKRLDINTIEDLLSFVKINLNDQNPKNLNKNISSEIKKNLLKLGFS